MSMQTDAKTRLITECHSRYNRAGIGKWTKNCRQDEPKHVG